MHDPRTTIAALNNADWCRLICAAHGVPSASHQAYWECLGRPPRLTPCAVSLSDSRAIPEELRFGHPEFSGLKDSFSKWDLTPFGMNVLFKAEWIWRDAAPISGSGLSWSVCRSETELEAWEADWAAHEEPTEGLPRQFPASMLDLAEVRFVRVHRAETPVGGGILNLASRVVGVSNVYSEPRRERDTLMALLEASEAEFPGRSQVGYERGEALEVATSLGFERMGKLRVWTT